MSEVTVASTCQTAGDGGNRQLTHVVRADLVGLIAPHHETDLLGLLVLQQPNVASSTLFPLIRV